MDSFTPRQSDRLAPSTTNFHVALVFLGTGILSNAMQYAFALWELDLAMNGLALAVLGLLAWLHRTGRVGAGPALVAAFATSTAAFLGGYFLDNLMAVAAGGRWTAHHQVPLILSLFGTVCGLAVDKRVAVWFGGACVAVELGYSFFAANGAFFRANLPLNVFVISGMVIMVWFYRKRLESLVGELDARLATVSQLKEKAERLNELNKPFVVFGRNTAGLIQDFSLDVQVLARHLGELRRAPAGEQSLILARMGGAMDTLNHRIEWVKYAASASPQRQEEELDLKTLVESAVYPFHLLPEYRGSVTFQVDVPTGVVVFGLRRWLLQAIEILVGRGCRAGAGHVEIEVAVEEPEFDEGGTVFLVYRDDAGPGVGDGESVRRVEEAVREFSGRVVEHGHGSGGTRVVMELGKNLGPALH